MLRVIILPKLEVRKYTEDQGFVGAMQANMAYQVTLKPGEGEDEGRIVTFTVAQIKETKINGEKTQVIIPNILFCEDGFVANDTEIRIHEDDYIDVRDIQSLKTVYVNRRFMQGGRRKSEDKDPFVFTFINAKNNKPFDVKVDHDHLVGVTVRTGADRKRTYIGFLDSIDKENRISMSHLECYKGIFSVESVTFDAENIDGVFNYHLVIEDYDAAMKAKQEARDKKKKKQKETKSTAKNTATTAESSETESAVPEDPTTDTELDDEASVKS